MQGVLCLKQRITNILGEIAGALANQAAEQPSSNKTYTHSAKTILKRVSQAMVAVILLQSIKLFWAPPYFHTQASVSLYAHLANMAFHLLVFASALYLSGKNIKLLYIVIIGGFCSYISLACLFWQVDLHLQYYFLLSMFICCYVINLQHNFILYLLIVFHLSLFSYFEYSLISIYDLPSADTNKQARAYLTQIRQINILVFLVSCLICALFARHTVATNWRMLVHCEKAQKHLLEKIFPPKYMPRLSPLSAYDTVDNIDPVRESATLGVIFLDICNSTQFTTSSNPNEASSWQFIYRLFRKLDDALNGLDVKRIKTNGDQFILLVGIEQQPPQEQIASDLVRACTIMQSTCKVPVKIGAALGEVTCGVFDAKQPNFDIWGTTVIRAARLESLAKANQILVDSQTYTALCKDSMQRSDAKLTINNKLYRFINKQEVYLKGLGKNRVYLLNAQ